MPQVGPAPDVDRNRFTDELERIGELPDDLADVARGVARDFSFVARQRGMFSYSGLTSAQVDVLRDKYGIYAVSTGRNCLAALNSLPWRRSCRSMISSVTVAVPSTASATGGA